jgi:hypothetical protein
MSFKSSVWLISSLLSSALALSLAIPSAQAQDTDDSLTKVYTKIQKLEMLARQSWPSFQPNLSRPILLINYDEFAIYAFRFHPKNREKWTQHIINGETVYVKAMDQEDPFIFFSEWPDLSLKQQSYENQAVMAFNVDYLPIYADTSELENQYLLEYEHYYSPRADWRHQQLKNLPSSFSSYKRPEVLAWLIEEVNLVNQYSVNPSDQLYRDYMAAAQKRRSLMTSEERAAEDAFGITCMPIFKAVFLSHPQDDDFGIGSDNTNSFLAMDYQITASLNFSVMTFLGLERRHFPWESAYASMNKTMSQITLDALNMTNKEIDQRINKIALSSEFKEISSQAQSLASYDHYQDQTVIKQYENDQGIELVIKSHGFAEVEAPDQENLIYTNSNLAYLYNPFAELDHWPDIRINLNYGTTAIDGENLHTLKMSAGGGFLAECFEQPSDNTFYFKLPAVTEVYINGEPANEATLLKLSVSSKSYESKESSMIEFINGNQVLMFNSWMGYRMYADHGRVIIEQNDSIFGAPSKTLLKSRLRAKLDHKNRKHASRARLARFKHLVRDDHKKT